MAERVPSTSVERARSYGAWMAVNHPEMTAAEIGRQYHSDTGRVLRPGLIRHAVAGARAKRRELRRRALTGGRS